MESIWTRCVELNNNVILDFGFWSQEERLRVREIITAHGGQAVLYHLSCPDDIAWERIQKRNKMPTNSLYIARETFDLLHERFEPLTPDEDFIEVSGNGS
ncbi:TPA: AAA family ATPase [Serratia marcescens]|nr:AAA family ATPase [Serratia marcescens]